MVVGLLIAAVIAAVLAAGVALLRPAEMMWAVLLCASIALGFAGIARQWSG